MRRWRTAGEQALGEHALSEAAGHFARAIELDARTPDSPRAAAPSSGSRVLAGQRSPPGRAGRPAVVDHYARAERLSRDVEATPGPSPRSRS